MDIPPVTTASTLNSFQLKVSMVKGVLYINYYSGFQFKINWLTGVHGRFGDTLMCVSELDITPVLDRTLVVSTYSYKIIDSHITHYTNLFIYTYLIIMKC